ncbi:MAG: TetR family transcriptional regulator [Vannielia sp.]|uniref:TetR/AcrR family transcriptional regulator n=1 Tax=Vannielia sp. TaxID=2813045 RepID=UPI003B8ABA29
MPKPQRSPWPGAEDRARERTEKREAVLSAALASFNEKGFPATSLGDVAASLGVTKPTLYHYFATKDDILFECVRRGLERIRAAASEVAGAGGSGRARLEALMQAYAVIMTEPYGICVIRTADHELSPESRAKFRALKREIDQTIRRVVQAGMDDGSLTPADPRVVTFTLTGALNWIARWYDPAGDDAPQSLAAAVTATLMNGLAPEPRP